ncbi:MAG: TIGR03808 family TAT-translocated repetitive protein [Hyphomicrobiaceae bacterium]
MTVDRRHIVTTAAALGALAAQSSAHAKAGPRAKAPEKARDAASSATLGVVPDSPDDQSAALQAAIDKAAERGVALALAPGRYRARGLSLREGSHIYGTAGRTVLAMTTDGTLITADRAHKARLDGLVLEGTGQPTAGAHAALVMLDASRDIVLANLEVTASRANGIALTGCSGTVRDCRVRLAAQAGIISLDAEGLEIVHNTVADCANNGILVWRSRAGEDGTIIANNRVTAIRAAAGGSGQNGNGINVFRAGNVLVTGNRITDCAYTAIRGNAASNIQMVANNCQRLGEVALYAEFGFEGALVSGNLVDGAATGIAVTNFNEGGRLAVVQGNLIRNLVRREHEPVDKRGEGIGVEADAVVTGNTIENAPTAGIVIGWGRYMREVVATSNVIRQARVGIMITRDPDAGAALVAQNMISGAREGAIRAMDKGVLVGPDLAIAGTQSSRISITGNVSLPAAG